MPDTIDLHLLGPATARVAGRPVVLGPKTVALLAFLAVEGGSSRERLLGTFWPDSPQKQAQGNLRYALHSLRQSLPGALRGDTGDVDLDRDVVRLDLDDLRSARTPSARAAAARLRRGSFCEGLVVSDLPDFDDWLETQRRQWDDAAVQNLLALALQLHPEEGLKPARQAIALDPTREASHQVLIGLLVRKGDRAEARRALQTCQERLWEELGVEPSADTLALLDAASETPVVRHNLPLEPAPLIGRGEAEEAVIHLLREHRLVTLAGEGGVGKTRLAVHIAGSLQPSPADGTWMVDLAGIAHVDDVEQAVAASAGVREGAPLVSELRDRDLLLLLDNCEHVLGRCASLVEELLHRCPRVRVLATSREPLKLAGEQVFPLDPLACPPPEHAHPDEFAAVRLFCERATEADARFVPDDLDAIADICRRLDGLPLAIELAASRTRVLSPRQIAERLDQRFRLLSGGRRTARPRQQTLHNLIDWSYQLLEPEEASLFRTVSIFRGGFTLEAAVALTGQDEFDVLDRLTRLVEKSLVRTEVRGGSLRYWLPESLRDFAAQALDETGETVAMQARHLQFFDRLAREVCPLTKGEKQRLWLDRLDAEIDNFRCALQRALDDAPETALSLAANLCPLWKDRNYRSSGRRFINLALACTGDSTERARALRLRGEIEFQLGDCEAALTSMEAGLALARRLQAPSVALECLKGRGSVLLYLERLDEARATLEEALQGLVDLGDQAEAAACRNNLGIVALHQGDTEEARRHFEESLAYYRSHKAPKAIGIILGNLGLVDLAEQRHDGAASHFADSLRELDRVGALWNAASCLEGMARLQLETGDWSAAVRSLAVAARVRTDLETPLLPVEKAAHARTQAALREALGPKWDELWCEARGLEPAALVL